MHTKAQLLVDYEGLHIELISAGDCGGSAFEAANFDVMPAP